LKKVLLNFAISFILLGWFLWRANLHDLWASLNSISWGSLLWATGVFFSAILVSAYKWNILLPASPFLLLLRLVLISLYYSMILPGQIAGEAMKIYVMGKGQKNAEQIAVSVLFDRMTGIIGLLLFCLGGIYLSRTEVPPSLAVSIAVVVVSLGGLLFSVRFDFFFRLLNRGLNLLQNRFTRLTNLTGQIIRALTAWRFYLQHKTLVLYSLLLALVFQFLNTLTCAILAGGLGIVLPFADWCWVLGMVSIAVFAPITIGGIGLREGVFVSLLGFIGAPPAQALALSFTIFYLTLGVAAVGGICEWIRMGRGGQPPGQEREGGGG
jgi:uncharacterized protein (TIRG00374 family)